MKFKATKSTSSITEGSEYHGSIVLESEVSINKSPNTSSKVKIVIFNDKGSWSSYSPSYFEPCEES
jgi:hypothetical protein